MSKSKPASAPMNTSGAVGIVGGIALLVIAVVATAADPLSFLNLPSAILVIVGTVAATLITYSFSDLGRALARFSTGA